MPGRASKVALSSLLEGMGVESYRQRWALCMVVSRSFSQAAGDASLMWPAIDALNHGYGSEATGAHWQYSPTAATDWDAYLQLGGTRGPGMPKTAGTGILAARDLKPGEELVISYGERSSFELRALYGFDGSGAAAGGGRAPMAAFGLAVADRYPRRGSPTAGELEAMASAGCDLDDYGLRVVRDLDLLGSSGPSPAMQAATRCLRTWLHRQKVGEASPWQELDVPLLESISAACGRLAHRWVSRIALLPPGRGARLGAAALQEARQAERCTTAARQALRDARAR